MNSELFLDFETTSKTDLKLHGLGRYLADPTTRAYCFTFRLPGMAATDLWTEREPMSAHIIRHIESRRPLVAHNAPFDWSIWNRILRRDRPELPEWTIAQTRCSAARARYNGLPGGLADACEVLGLPVQKDTEGGKVMMQIAPHPERSELTHPELFARVYKYALTDTDAMIGLWNATQPLPAREQAFFELDMQINERGFGVDLEAAIAMEELKALAEVQLDYQMAVATAGAVLSVNEIGKLKAHAGSFGQELDDAGREALKTLSESEGLAPELKALLQLRLDASRTPKKQSAILRAHVGGRVHHSTKWYGALSGRSTASGAGGLQSLNFARPRPGRKPEDCEDYLAAVKRRDMAYLSSDKVGPALAAMADAQRALVCATEPDCILVGADQTGIEARMAPWLANDEAMLQEIEQGIDGYKVEAAAIYGIEVKDVSKDQRQEGKVVRLSLGFGGGVGALDNMAETYGLHIPREKQEIIVESYRTRRPAFERWWSALEYAVLVALDQPGKPVELPTGRGFCTVTTFLRDDRALRMILPSGRTISYHNARLHLEPGANVPIAIYDKPEGYVETLDRKILSNNQTQGLARDSFWEVMVDVAPVENIVHHVYDEVILEVPIERAQLRKEQLVQRMHIAPKWAPGLPIAAAGWVNHCWKKD
jgi:DNA polymerase